MKTIQKYYQEIKENWSDFTQTILLLVGGILMLFLLGVCQEAKAQSFHRNGKVLVSNTTRTVTKDTLLTDYSWQDSKGVNYPIVINRQSGRCYIWKVSSKTNKYYKMYLKEDASREIAQLLGIQYVEKQKR